jgi:hypothetical protein
MVISKTPALICSLAFYFAGVVRAQPLQSDIDVAFEGLAAGYSSSQDVTAQIVNRSRRPLYFYCSVEAQIEYEWREIMYSIDQAVPRKAIKLTMISPNERVAVSWPADRRQAWGAGTYRLVVFLSEVDTPALSPSAFRSEPFVLNGER